MTHGDVSYTLLTDILSLLFSTIITQGVSFLNFSTLRLFSSLRLAPKFNVSLIVLLNFAAFITTNVQEYSAAYLLVLGVWILAILISGTAVGIYIPNVMTKAQKRSRTNLFGLIRVKYAFIILTVLDWIGLGFYIYKVIAIPDSILRLIIGLQKLPYDIVATSFAGIHFSLLAHVHHYTFKIASKIKDEQKKAQLNIKRRKNANSDHENVNEDSKIEEDEVASISSPSYH
ncbi:hypothetical protein HDV04_005263 [Boothiomyces sp. JEL0838]|nr:hypothetical protein HDV04_005263 [Boothiomyces sp. JEL0838]